MKTLAVTLLCSASAVAASASDVPALEARVAAIVARSRSTVGVGLRDLASGETVLVRGRDHFPMFSVYKLPIAMRVLQRVDEGALRLTDPVAIEPKDVRPGVSTAVTARLRDGHGTLTVAELVQAAVAQSDNTASDVILRLAGGPEAVTAYVRSLGIEGLRVDRPEVQMAADTKGVGTPQRRARRAAIERYVADPRDSATPEAALALLARVAKRDALSPASAEFLLRTLEKTTTGARPHPRPPAEGHGRGEQDRQRSDGTRLHGGLERRRPRHAALRPADRGRGLRQRERRGRCRRATRTIAEIARAAFDHWSR